MTQWTHNFTSHRGEHRGRSLCASVNMPRAYALGLSKDSVIAPARPPG
jgi:hypothetical protein